MSGTAGAAPGQRGRALWLRRGLLLVGLAAALTGFLAGLARLGLLVGWGPAYAYAHGPLLVLGLFGTVIGLERAVALGRTWAFAAPALGAATALALFAGLPIAPWLGAGAAFALGVVNAAIVARQALAFTWLMLAGSVVYTAGAVAWALGLPLFQVVPAWLGFFVLTIVAERLELSRLAPTPAWASRLLVAVAGVFALAAVAGLGEQAVSARVFGAAMMLLGLWQLRFDLARFTVRQRGLPRFSAVGVLLGAGWLALSGAGFALLGPAVAGPRYDGLLHGVFVGYVLSMVLAHGPIILPAVARLAIPFHPALWLAPAVLHVGLVVRLAGDFGGEPALRTAGSVANVAALLCYAGAIVYARRTGRMPRKA